MPASFHMEDHGLRRLRVACFSGLVFGTFSSDTPAIEDYLGPVLCARIKRVLDRPLKVLGRNTQVLHSNWKIYMENIKDSYHASILHLFFTTFRINRLNTKGEILLDDTGAHHVSYSMMDLSIDNTEYGSQKLRADRNDLLLADPEIVEWTDEFGDGITLQILSVFPTFVVQQHLNAIAVRHLRPAGLETCEVAWTYLGFEGDDPAMARRRLKQGNLVGPAGYISMEDGAVTGFVQRASKGVEEDSGVVMMGGEGVESQPFRATETAVRGFWKRYRELMEPVAVA